MADGPECQGASTRLLEEMNERNQHETLASADERQRLLDDLQNVIAVMAACCDAMYRRLPPGQADREFAEVQRCADRASLLTREILSQDRPANVEPAIDVNRFILQHGGILLRLLGPTVSVRMQLTPLPSRVHAAPEDLERILLNLVLNARDTMAGGGVITLETSVVARADASLESSVVDAGHAGPFLRLTVSDAGPGMPEVVDHLTEACFTTKHTGTGAGMTTLRATVKQLSGALRIETSRRSGSRVMVLLPLVAVSTAPEAVASGGRPTPAT